MTSYLTKFQAYPNHTATCIWKCSFAACLRVADRGRDALATDVVTMKLTYLP
jgi:hypothetical protein